MARQSPSVNVYNGYSQPQATQQQPQQRIQQQHQASYQATSQPISEQQPQQQQFREIQHQQTPPTAASAVYEGVTDQQPQQYQQPQQPQQPQQRQRHLQRQRHRKLKKHQQYQQHQQHQQYQQPQQHRQLQWQSTQPHGNSNASGHPLQPHLPETHQRPSVHPLLSHDHLGNYINYLQSQLQNTAILAGLDSIGSGNPTRIRDAASLALAIGDKVQQLNAIYSETSRLENESYSQSSRLETQPRPHNFALLSEELQSEYRGLEIRQHRLDRDIQITDQYHEIDAIVAGNMALDMEWQRWSDAANVEENARLLRQQSSVD